MATKRNPKRKTRTYACPNPNKPLCLKAIVKKIRTDKDFAKFIADLLCKAHNGDTNASRCVDSYFEPDNNELEGLCIPKSKRKYLCRCTDPTHHLLIDFVAHEAAGTRKR
jgi:hypothetical protein